MRDAGDILIVACYELGHQPLAVAWPVAFLERASYRPAVMDVAVEPFDAERVRRARFVAVSVPMHTALRLGVTLVDRIRAANPRCHLCFFGLYAGLNAEYLFARGVDSVISGEIETPLTELVAAIEHGDERPVPFVMRPGRSASPHLQRADFPVPSRTRLPSLETYAKLERDGKRLPVAYVESSRGCLHHCRHCPIPPVYGGRFFAVSRQIVLADIRQQVAAGARHVTFGDPDFLNGPTHALKLCRELHAEFPELTFDFTAKIEHLERERERLAEFAELGCLYIISAAESLSDRVLAHLHKGHTRADITSAMKAVREAGIHFKPTWVAFTPWTTLGDYRELLEFHEREDLIDHVDAVQYSLRLLIPPGSLLLSEGAMRPYLGPLEEETLSYRWTHPDPRMDQLQQDLARLVTEAAERGEDNAVTFERISGLCDTLAGCAPRTTAASALAADRRRPPRITEPWFC